jgi:sialate O-acetylesterase
MRLASIFSDGAVLQREMSIPIWGWTQPGARVLVQLGSVQARSIAADDGKFMVRLPSQKAGGPFVLSATNLDNDQSCKSQDVWVGEVWLASGQSNMEWSLSGIGAPGETEIAEAKDTGLRMFTVPHEALLGQKSDVKSSWQSGVRPNVATFSAVAYFFAKRLRRELGVVVGVLHSSWGGTMVEAWTARPWLAQNPFTAHLVARYEQSVQSPEFWSRNETTSHPYPADPGNKGEPAGWAKPEFNAAGWPEAKLPNMWQNFGHNYSGVFWFRKTVDVPAAWAGKALSLRVGAVDKHDTTYFNGQKVGSTGLGVDVSCWNTQRDYTVPGHLVKAGTNVIAVRAYSFIFAGGLIGPASVMKLAPADESAPPLPLDGVWKYQEEHNLGLTQAPSQPQGPGNPHTPYILHDTMIVPLQPYAIRGAIWYQGESNAGRASEYRSLLTDMVRSWRSGWGQGDFPFVQVQLANFRAAQEYEQHSTWAYLREAQTGLLSEPHTGMAVAIDIGDAADIHPTNKLDVGHRLAQWALAKTYGKHIVPSGPLYRSMTIEGSKIRLHFDHIGGGLLCDGSALRTFFIAGLDRRFVRGDAVIEGSTVLVSSAEVPEPAAVRYAWADNPEGCNLRNVEGLPASPFRTDAWV